MSEPAPVADAAIGHNNPPSAFEVFAEKVKTQYPHDVAKVKDLLEAEARIPDLPEDASLEEMDKFNGKLGDYSKQLIGAAKGLDQIRVMEKQVYLEGERMVDGVFKKLIEPIEAANKRVKVKIVDLLEKKKQANIRADQEKARIAREKMEEDLRKSQEAAAEAKRKQDEAEAEAARIKKEAAEAAAKIAAAAEKDRQEKQAEIDKLEAEKKALEKKKEEDDETAAAELRKVNAELKKSNDELARVDKTEKAETKILDLQVKQEEAVVSALKKEAKADERAAGAFFDDAIRADKTATKVEKLATLPAGHDTFVRGDQGSRSSLSTKWEGSEEDRAQLDLEALRYHFTADSIQLAINAHIRANPGKPIKGVWVRQENTGVVR